MRTRLLALLILFASACSADSALQPDPLPELGLGAGVNGQVVWMSLEGGFWAIRTDDGRLLDPHQTLPAEFRLHNLRVRVAAEQLMNAGCVHQAGIIVAITDIQQR